MPKLASTGEGMIQTYLISTKQSEPKAPIATEEKKTHHSHHQQASSYSNFRYKCHHTKDHIETGFLLNPKGMQVDRNYEYEYPIWERFARKKSSNHN